MKNNYISIIIPIKDINPDILKYRNKYDKFASYGIPPHISLIYNIPIDKYLLHKKYLDNIFKKFLEIINKSHTNIKNIIKTKTLLALGLSNKISNFINKVQLKIDKKLELNNSKYKDKMFYPHITLFTGHKNKGWKEYNKIKTTIDKYIPFDINITTLYILEIDPNKNKAKKIDEIKIN